MNIHTYICSDIHIFTHTTPVCKNSSICHSACPKSSYLCVICARTYMTRISSCSGLQHAAESLQCGLGISTGCEVCTNYTYRISRNIGDIFNLAIWRSGSKLPNFYHQIYIYLLTMLCPCCATAKFNFQQYFRMYSNLYIPVNCMGLCQCTVWACASVLYRPVPVYCMGLCQ